ncbi:MAG: hypothetical protein R2731_03540 [Nocardioides sp.]
MSELERQLRDRLAGLAEAASDAVPPRGLWAVEQRRRAEIRRFTVLVAAAALALVGLLLGAAWRVAQPPAPATTRSEVGLPDRLYDPSRWLRTAPGAELGQLVAIQTASQGGWWGGRPGVVAVSAATGEYAFLDLPDLAAGDVALSPDGRAVAYWTMGTPSGPPHRDDGGDTITGVAVLDTATGEVHRWEVPTEHGLGPQALTFVSGDSLWISYSQYLGGVGDPESQQFSSQGQPVRLWRFRSSVPQVLGLPAGVSGDIVAARNGRAWVEGRLVDLTAEANPRSRRLSAMGGGAGMGGVPRAGLSADGRWLATLGGASLPDRLPNGVVLYDLDSRRRGGRCCGPGHVLTGSTGTWGVLGWRDGRRLVLLQRQGELQPEGPSMLRRRRWLSTWPRGAPHAGGSPRQRGVGAAAVAARGRPPRRPERRGPRAAPAMGPACGDRDSPDHRGVGGGSGLATEAAACPQLRRSRSTSPHGTPRWCGRRTC